MLLARFILGGICAVTLGVMVHAEPIIPTDRIIPQVDSHILRVAGEHAPQFALRPQIRPDDMPDHFTAYDVPVNVGGALLRPQLRPLYQPDAAWDHRADGEDWTRSLMEVLAHEGAALDDVVPRDIAQWCPAYPNNPPVLRRAFWAGMMSTLAEHESTWNPRAVGGGGQWFGLLQIYPPTARLYGCEARTGEALRDAEDNLACAARIMAATVTRDGAVALHDGRWRGVAADWGPMTSRAKREDMAAWTREQDYCRPVLAIPTALRPQARPGSEIFSPMPLPWREALDHSQPEDGLPLNRAL